MRPERPGARRRTPGLRREELAERAGIGATWCAWIEQGREVNASPRALARLATALALTRAERAYMFELAGRRDPEAAEPAPAADAPASIRAGVKFLTCPAYGLDGLWNACCWNPAAQRLFSDWLGPGHQKNLLRYVFDHPAAKALIPRWEDRARRLLSEFRADYGRRLNDPRARQLVDELRGKSLLFAAAWEAQAVAEREGGVRTFTHPQDGALAFRQHTFSPAERPDYKLVALTPVAD
jgi:transcriptional regulator with XRE-family HTH domain